MNTGKNVKADSSYFKIFNISSVILWSMLVTLRVAHAHSEVADKCKELAQDEYLKKCDDKTVQVCATSPIIEAGLFQVEWSRRQFSEKQFEEAESYLRGKSQSNPFDINVGLALAEILTKNNKIVEAEIELSRLSSIYPKSTKVKSLRGRIFLAQGKIKEANTDFKSVLSNVGQPSPSFLDTMRFIDTSLSLKNIKEAQAILNKTVPSNSQDGYLLDYEWGRLYHSLGEINLSRRYFEAALKGKPDSEATVSAYVDLLLDEKKELEAKSIIGKYSNSGGLNPKIFLKLGLIHLKYKEYDSAKKIFQSLLDKSQDENIIQQANLGLARVEIREGSVGLAVKRLEELRTKFKWIWISRSLSRLYFLAQQNTKAKDLAQEAYNLSAEDTDKKWLAGLENNKLSSENRLAVAQVAEQDNAEGKDILSVESNKLDRYLSGQDSNPTSPTSANEKIVKNSPTKIESGARFTRVKKNETLAGVSNRIFGTHKKWKYLLELNKDKISQPDQITAGLVLRTSETLDREPANDLRIEKANLVVPARDENKVKRRRVNRIDEFTMIKRNESLADVSYRIFGTHTKWKYLQKINKELIADPDQITPGMKIRIRKPAQELAEKSGDETGEQIP